MKTIIELASEAGFVSAQFWPDDFKGLQASVERFATLVEAAHTDELLEGVEMPEPVCKSTTIEVTGEFTNSFYTADQLRKTVASAVAKKDAERDTLKAENERLRADAARYQHLKNYYGYSYSMQPDSPAEHGIEYQWQQGTYEERNNGLDLTIDLDIESKRKLLNEEEQP